MALAGSPKRLAQDIAEGYLMITPPMLRQHAAADLRTLLANIAVVTRELRAEAIPLEEIVALKMRNMKLSRLRQAEVVIRAYGKKHRLPL